MSSHEKGSGTLYLLPVWLGADGGPDLLPARNTALASGITLYFAEREKSARHLLRRMVPGIDLGALEIHRLDKDTGPGEIDDFIALLRTRDGAIISEAGMPCIADPGARLVRAAHQQAIRVVPLSGPSSVLLALAASGLNGQAFSFHGYLPRAATDRKHAIKALEQAAQRTGASRSFIETPYRNEAMLDELLRTCQPTTLLCIAVDVGQPTEEIMTRTIAEWRQRKPALADRPATFIIGTA
jgi:16S rRNA (cytidine1402-2'-O)-methyltransferase